MTTATPAHPRAAQAPATRRLCGRPRAHGAGPCTRPAGWGTDHAGFGACKFHGGSSPNGRKAAQLEAARASLDRLGVPVTDANPVDLLSDLVDQAAGVVAVLAEQVKALGPGAIVTGDGPHPLVRLYGIERDRAARVAREAVALGLEERRVRIDELTRERLVRLFVMALSQPELGLSPEQIEAAQRVAARLIRAGAVPA